MTTEPELKAWFDAWIAANDIDMMKLKDLAAFSAPDYKYHDSIGSAPYSHPKLIEAGLIEQVGEEMYKGTTALFWILKATGNSYMAP